MGLFKKQKIDLNKNIFEGTSIQQALANASEALKVPPDQISYDVISYGSTGVFGLVGNKRAKIRVRSSMRVKEKALSATEKYWREIQEEQGKFASKELNREKQTKVKDEPKQELTKPKSNVKKGLNNCKQRFDKEKDIEKPYVAATEEYKRQNSPRNRKRTPKSTSSLNITDEAFLASSEMDAEKTPLSGQFAQAYDVLQNLTMALLGKPCQIMYRLTEKKISFILKGENLSVLIGKNGNTRRSLQLVADRIVNKGGNCKYDVNVVVDTQRQNKSKQFLTTLAKKKADQCRKTQEKINLGMMNAYERCVIHIALKKDPDVETKSIGEGAQKEIFIVPVDKKKIPVPKNEDTNNVSTFNNATES